MTEPYDPTDDALKALEDNGFIVEELSDAEAEAVAQAWHFPNDGEDD